MPLSPKALAFLMENRFRNSRVWYQEHRQEYLDQVLAPVKSLVEELEPYLLKMDEKIVTEPKVDKTISRVYRDTRFSRDKTLYRERVWCVFMRDKHRFPGYPGFFFEFSPSDFRYGCGYYDPAPKSMELMRKSVLQGDPLFKKAKLALERQTVFSMGGACYKRRKYPDEPQELQDWLERRDISVSAVSTDFDLLFSQGLARTVGEGFLTLEPVYRFLCRVQEKYLEQEKSVEPRWE